MTGVLCAMLAASGGFTPITRTYTTGTGATETIPSGAHTVTIETFGGAGGGGGGGPALKGGGGGGGGYSKTILALTSGNWGQTMIYSVGVGGTAGGASVSGGPATNTSRVSSGTFTLTTMGDTANGGLAGITGAVSGAGGAGGSVSGGNTTNTTGNTGTTQGNGAVALTGTFANGNPGGNGGAISGAGTAGGNGVVAFHYG